MPVHNIKIMLHTQQQQELTKVGLVFGAALNHAIKRINKWDYDGKLSIAKRDLLSKWKPECFRKCMIPQR